MKAKIDTTSGFIQTRYLPSNVFFQTVQCVDFLKVQTASLGLQQLSSAAESGNA